MHLNCGLALVPAGFVRERIEGKIAVKFAIDTDQKVEIEFRRHALLVVVGGDQGLDVLAQVDADNGLAAVSDMLAHPAEQSDRVGWPKIAERAAREKRRARASGDIGRNVKVGRKIGDDRPRRRSGNRSRNRSTVSARKSAAISIGAYMRGR